jgi:tetratricopeptide (TPR) repeat protein
MEVTHLKSKPKKSEQINREHLKNLVRNFFTKSDIVEYLKNYFDQWDKKEKVQREISAANKKQIEFVFDDAAFRTQVDILITFAQSKLTSTRFLEFLQALCQQIIAAGNFSYAIEIQEKIIELNKSENSFIGITANSHISLGELYSRQALWRLSLKNIRAAEKILKEINDSKGIAKCENLLGTIYGDLGDFNKASQHFENCLSLLNKQSSEDGEKILRSKVEINLGIIHNILGRFDLSISYLKRALLSFEDTNDWKRIAEIRHNMGMALLKKNEIKQAIAQFDKSINAAIEAGFLPSLGLTYVSKAYTYTLLKDFALAEAFTDKAMDICSKTNDNLSIAEVYKVKGIIQRYLLNFDLAESFFLTSLRINKELGNKLNEAETYYELGMLYKDIKRKKESDGCFKNALSYYKKIKDYFDAKQLESMLTT